MSGDKRYEEETFNLTDNEAITIGKENGKVRRLLIEVATYSTNFRNLTALIQLIATTLKPDIQLGYTVAGRMRPDKILTYDFIPLYILYEGGVSGIHYYMAPCSYAFTMCFGHLVDRATKYPIFFNITINQDLTEEDVKIIAYTVGYTIYAIGKGYAYNADPEKAILIQEEHDRYVDNLDPDEIGDADWDEIRLIKDPIGHIFKVDMPLFDIRNYDYMLRNRNIRFMQF